MSLTLITEDRPEGCRVWPLVDAMRRIGYAFAALTSQDRTHYAGELILGRKVTTPSGVVYRPASREEERAWWAWERARAAKDAGNGDPSPDDEPGNVGLAV